MDPFTAIRLASNIITFIEFIIKVACSTSEIYHSETGETDENAALLKATTHLEKASGELSAQLPVPCSSLEKKVADIALDCKREADKMLKILEPLQAPAKGKLTSVTVALSTFWKRKDIQARSKRLAGLRSTLILQLVDLINDRSSNIEELVTNLTETCSKTSAETMRRLDKLQHTIKELKDSTQKNSKDVSDSKKLNIESLAHKLDLIREIGDPIAREQQILKNLRFESMLLRESAVAEAHAQTYEWVFSHQSNFRQWMSHGDKYFWISGKPGSGKSTLMKFISHHPETATLLKAWANGQHLVIASFYFWSSGTTMQKSLQGLVQSLLFEMMRQCPSIVPLLCPKRWENAFLSSVDEPWTWDEVKAAFKMAMQQDNMPAKFCFFIDGLDEYSGDPKEMIKLLSRAWQSANMKFCLASRPDNIFQSSLGFPKERMLRLQDLTREDISRYTRDTLDSHRAFIHLKSRDKNYEYLVNEIVDRADGVFLWVILVVRSLSEGLTNADTVSMLHQRLQQLPSDLERFFTHILDGVDETYREGTAKAFQMAMAAVYPLPLWAFSIFNENETDLACKTPMTADEIREQTELLSTRLNARCKGLLEVRLSSSSDYPDLHRVKFLHRTVRDFLRVKSLDLLIPRQHIHFDVDKAICMGFLMQIKQLHLPNSQSPYANDKMLDTALNDLIYYANLVENRTGQPPVDILEECSRCFSKTPAQGHKTFYHYVVREGLFKYLQHLLRSNANFLRTVGGEPLLSIALTSTAQQSQGSRYNYELNLPVVQLLLDHGADPNQSSYYSDGSVWKYFVGFLQYSTAGGSIDQEVKAQAFRLMISAAANMNIELSERRELEQVVYSTFSWNEAKPLIQFIRDLEQGDYLDLYPTPIYCGLTDC
ncbi:unnamed protein product [Clonostachys byssicola]|uniref:NACHT domain-containing protein n=1 Tax=Clonostachys byssicola TaxID=160290 RepID=A0A9N9Y8A8_9HYPO|nr:unnamed protein product [Clonostachys byssicola]